MRLAPAVLLICATGEAAADGWVVAETPAAVAVSDAQSGAFRPGVMPAVGAYAATERWAVGLRLRAGVLRNGPQPGDHLKDPGLGGLGTAGLALRLLVGGGWAEVVGGGGLTGTDLVPAVEAGVGWSFEAGSIDLGPSVRYARVISEDPMHAFGSAELLLVGVDVRFGRERSRVRAPIAAAPLPRPRPAAIELPAVDRDRDRIVELEASCAQSLDGCPIAEHITIEDDRIILEEQVLFDLNRVRVRSQGRAVLAQIAKMWAAHPEWQRITVEGHACELGTDELNDELSRRRAERVRAWFVGHGVSTDRIDSVGYGRTRPRVDGSSDEAHRKNRRVEFVIHRGGTP